MKNSPSFKRSPSTLMVHPLICALLIFATGLSFAQAAVGPEALIKAYYSYLLVEHSVQQTRHAAQSFSTNIQQQVQTSNETWMNKALLNIRQTLTQQVGPTSKKDFQEFVAEYTQAEKDDDLGYLAVLSSELGMTDLPKSYSEFNNRYTNQKLDTQIHYCADYISEVLTWLDVQSKNPEAPGLHDWLNKDQPMHTSVEKKSTAGNALRNAEDPLPEFEDLDAEDDLSPMDTFSQMHDKRRDHVAKQAQAGMAQVAAERAAAEAAYADKKATAAQAEADAVASQARKLATAEADALSQRQNSWSARLKKIVSGTISGTVGAFTGGIGAEAGLRAADAVFDND